MLRILICDDDRSFSSKMRDAVRAVLKEQEREASIHIVDQVDTIPEQLLRSVDIAFLDIDFAGQTFTGIDIARKLRAVQRDAVIIFVTNYIEYAPEGYEVMAFRYLLKKDLDKKLDSYLRMAIAKLQEDRECIQVNISGAAANIPLVDILYFEAQGHDAVLHLMESGKQEVAHLVRTSLKKLEDQLTSGGFLRIQKSYLVNMRRLRKLQCSGAELDNGTVLPVSEKKYSAQKIQYLLWKGRQ